jgi:hypothetical protein
MDSILGSKKLIPPCVNVYQDLMSYKNKKMRERAAAHRLNRTSNEKMRSIEAKEQEQQRKNALN